ncbi:MAG: hypothetical protein MZW92_26475, partial [Comamonadaceae bacterium]|nr:hypothetical protein [Comamonadaceae bacterium]
CTSFSYVLLRLNRRLQTESTAPVARWAPAASPPRRAEADDRALFVKTLPAAQADRLEAEADGLRRAGRHRRDPSSPAVAGPWARTPARQRAWRSNGWTRAFSLDAAPTARASAARSARCTAAAPAAGGGRYGWPRDNVLGAAPQRNAPDPRPDGARRLDRLRRPRMPRGGAARRAGSPRGAAADAGIAPSTRDVAAALPGPLRRRPRAPPEPDPRRPLERQPRRARRRHARRLRPGGRRSSPTPRPSWP